VAAFPRPALAIILVAERAPMCMTHELAVIDMATIVKAATVAEAVARDDGAGVVHERSRQTPAALIEIACGTGIMAGVGDMAAMRQTADTPRLIAMCGEVRDQRLKACREMACNSNRPGGG
jgi:hypothetical protein